MSGNIIYKFILTLAVIFWCIASITPLRDRPFEEYIVDQATAEVEEFADVMDRAAARVENGKAPTLFIALRDMGVEEKINYAKFFPEINLRDVANQNKRNDILLKYLLDSAKSQLSLGLDLKGGVGFTLVMDETELAALNSFEQEEQLSKAIGIMSDRLDSMGVAEPVIRAKGETAIEVQLAGETTKDNPDLLTTITAPARLEFRTLHPDLNPDTTPLDRYPVGYEVLAEEIEDRNSGEIYERRLFVKLIPEATGVIVEDAFVSQTPTGGFQINLVMTDDGSKIFRSVTEKMVGEPLAIVLDGKLYSAPTIQAVLSKNAQITGSFSQREAIELASVLNNPLSVKLKPVDLYEVGPTLAKGTRDSSIKAAKYGAILVIGFMIIYYFAGGVIAVLSSFVNVVIVLGVLASLGATLTLPGVAALVLTLGMGVDANILIF
ncbi:MAG: protein translocase subunit SecDF, partial [Verrucomicrobiota bacterium]